MHIGTYMGNLSKSQLLEQIAAIPAMERGTLSSYSFKDRSGANGPYHKLQRWENGKNKTRYVSPNELEALQAALAGYAQFEQLTQQYAQLVIAETRQNIATLKKSHPHRPSSWPRKRKSKG